LYFKKINQSSHPWAFGTIIFWASAYVFTKVALTHFSAFGLGVLRYLTASFALLLLAVSKKIGFPETKDIPGFFLTGAIGFTLYMTTFNIGSQTLTSSTASVIIATVPVITAFLAGLIFKEILSPWRWFAIFIEFLGILILLLWNGIFSINAGIIWMLSAALLLSLYNLLQKQYTKKYSPIQSTTYSMIAGTILLLIFLPETIPQIISASKIQTLVIIYLGIFPSAIAYIWWSKALSVAKNTSDVSNYMFLTPLLSTLLGYVIIRETPDVATCIGGVVILIGLILFSICSRN
jgi:drug/metabolite transporter (DMT)-like permease